MMYENLLPLHDDIMYPPETEPEGPGCILVVVGPPGAGKDTLMKGVLEDPFLRFQKGVKYASREPRDGEIPGYDYHFVSAEELFRKNAQQELAEMAPTGKSYKGTPKNIFERVQRGEKVVWRIDTSRAAGLPEFFAEKFPDNADYYLSRTMVITVLPENLEDLYIRAAQREGAKFNYEDFDRRVDEELTYLQQKPERFQNILYNDSTPKNLVQKGLKMINGWIKNLQSQEAVSTV